MGKALSILILAAGTASAESRIPKVLTLSIDGPAVPLSAADGPALPPPIVVEISRPADLRDSLNEMTQEEQRAFAVDPDGRWRCAASYRDAGGVTHFVKGMRFSRLERAVRSALADCRTAAGKASGRSCAVPELGCRFGSPPKRKTVARERI